MLGHKDIRLTLNTYSHISPDMQDTVVSAMNQAINRSQKQQLTLALSPKSKRARQDSNLRPAD
jgi:hypothetical protein